MKWNKEYLMIAIGYLIVVFSILIWNNIIVSSVLVGALFFYHLQRYNQIRRTLEQERDMTMSKLRHRLKKTERQQNELSDRFNSLSQSFGSGLLLVDEDGIIQFSNYDMNDYFGRDFNQLDYQSIVDTTELYEFVNQAYLLESTLQNQIDYQGRSYDLISTPLLDEDMFKGALILAHDITQIKHAQEYQKRFTADVSHELRTPLSAIKGFSEILLRDSQMTPEEQKEFTTLIHKEAERMEILISDLSEISKLDRIDFELEKRPIDIRKIMEECLAILSQPIKDSGLDVKVDMDSYSMNIDPNKMSQVFTNIIKNAINYTDKGSITIRGFVERNRYKVTITDTGIGINEKHYDKIFKRFYRVDKARSRDTGGSGLGLSISKNVVLKHGGSLTVSSKPNKGSTFTIALPIQE